MSSFGDYSKESKPEERQELEVQQEEKPKTQRDLDVGIKLARLELYRRRYYVVYEVDKPSNVYLVDKDEVQNTTGIQKVARSVLKTADKPYNWDEELKQFSYTLDEMRLALYRAGLIEAPEQPIQFKTILAKLLKSGILPIVKE